MRRSWRESWTENRMCCVDGCAILLGCRQSRGTCAITALPHAPLLLGESLDLALRLSLRRTKWRGQHSAFRGFPRVHRAPWVEDFTFIFHTFRSFLFRRESRLCFSFSSPRLERYIRTSVVSRQNKNNNNNIQFARPPSISFIYVGSWICNSRHSATRGSRAHLRCPLSTYPTFPPSDSKVRCTG